MVCEVVLWCSVCSEVVLRCSACDIVLWCSACARKQEARAMGAIASILLS